MSKNCDDTPSASGQGGLSGYLLSSSASEVGAKHEKVSEIKVKCKKPESKVIISFRWNRVTGPASHLSRDIT